MKKKYILFIIISFIILVGIALGIYYLSQYVSLEKINELGKQNHEYSISYISSISDGTFDGMYSAESNTMTVLDTGEEINVLNANLYLSFASYLTSKKIKEGQPFWLEIPLQNISALNDILKDNVPDLQDTNCEYLIQNKTISSVYCESDTYNMHIIFNFDLWSREKLWLFSNVA